MWASRTIRTCQPPFAAHNLSALKSPLPLALRSIVSSTRNIPLAIFPLDPSLPSVYMSFFTVFHNMPPTPAPLYFLGHHIPPTPPTSSSTLYSPTNRNISNLYSPPTTLTSLPSSPGPKCSPAIEAERNGSSPLASSSRGVAVIPNPGASAEAVNRHVKEVRAPKRQRSASTEEKATPHKRVRYSEVHTLF
jgi:hypothetical protein